MTPAACLPANPRSANFVKALAVIASNLRNKAFALAASPSASKPAVAVAVEALVQALQALEDWADSPSGPGSCAQAKQLLKHPLFQVLHCSAAEAAAAGPAGIAMPDALPHACRMVMRVGATRAGLAWLY